jgi:hypothetical protein
MDATKQSTETATRAPAREWPTPTPEQIALVARVLAPHIHKSRAQRVERSAA